MLLPPMKCTVSVLKQEFKDATKEAIKEIYSDQPNRPLTFLSYIVGAQGAFWVYGGTEEISEPIEFREVFGCIKADGEFSEILAYFEQIVPGNELPDVKYDLYELEDGTIREVPKGDEPRCLFLRERAIEAIQEMAKDGELDEFLGPKGCPVYCGDQGVAGTEDYLEIQLKPKSRPRKHK